MPSDDTRGKKNKECEEAKYTEESEEYGLLGRFLIIILVMATVIVLSMQAYSKKIRTKCVWHREDKGKNYRHSANQCCYSAGYSKEFFCLSIIKQICNQISMLKKKCICFQTTKKP